MTLGQLTSCCFKSPKLYYIHPHASNRVGGYQEKNKYFPNLLECVSDAALGFRYFTLLPPIVHTVEPVQYFGTVLAVLSLAVVVRGIGRYINPQYTVFLDTWGKSMNIGELKKKEEDDTANNNNTNLMEISLECYDYEFSYYKTMYHCKGIESSIQSRTEKKTSTSDSAFIIDKAVGLVRYMLAFSVGTFMIYPGSTRILNYIMQDMLLKGRVALLYKSQGKRYKLKTYTNEHVDCMYIDRRTTSEDKNKGNNNGNKLVIVSEGNASFYEMSCCNVVSQKGFSVMGWNHPGFGASTGTPTPENEESSIVTVIEFAVNNLGWDLSDIILHSWSIGGYATSRAAAIYNKIHGIVLDAPFDHIVPLALIRMPTFAHTLVVDAIHQYYDLDVAESLSKYKGRVKVIRRLKDEIISTTPGKIGSNRTNHVMAKCALLLYSRVVSHRCTTFDIYEYLVHKLNKTLYSSKLEVKLMLENSKSDPNVDTEADGNKSSDRMCLGNKPQSVTDSIDDTVNRYYEDESFTLIQTENWSDKEHTLALLWILTQHVGVDENVQHCHPLTTYPISF